MAPQTCCSQVDHMHGAENRTFQTFGTSLEGNTMGSNSNTTRPKDPLPAREKHTFNSTNIAQPTASSSDMQASTPKKMRTVGPSYGHPMLLKLDHEKENVNPNGNLQGNMINKGKQVVQHTSSFYPGHSDTTHPLASLAHFNVDDQVFYNPNVDDHNNNFKEDYNEDEEIAELALKNPTKFAEVMATEVSGGVDVPRTAKLTSRHSLEEFGSAGSGSSHASVNTTPAPMPTLFPTPAPGAHMLEHSASPSEMSAMTGHASTASAVSRDTDLVFANGSNKLMLTNQHPIICAIVRDATELLRASLVFTNAFPDPVLAFNFAKQALLSAAQNNSSGVNVLSQLQDEDELEYVAKLVTLPHARISLFRAEVKDCCNSITVLAFFMMGSIQEIARIVKKQMSHYMYTFPSIPQNALNGVVKCSQPYRNEQIITVICDLYFTGYPMSFAVKYEDRFPLHRGDDGTASCEVPIPMVALVVTALYATLREWQMGEQQTFEFSTNAYMDTYLGHVNTLNHILENRERAFHVMMSDIYAQASISMANNGNGSVVPIADLDLDLLKD
ncbi:hypothetical protein V8E53_004186 [Lactarius tabidus]